MEERSNTTIVKVAKDFMATLKTSYLLMLVTALFVADVFIFDTIPFIDEITLFALTVLIARWKSRARQEIADAPKPPPKDVTPQPSREE